MKVIDVVCGKELAERDAWSQTVGDETYYFCSERCRDAFAREPQDFLDGETLRRLVDESLPTWARR